ncbi:hypothetical protein [Candidatus Lokiarchaeum ossiferum]|uniref:hypothetical protein n=1 Tax=Candidatus Lokiarchaeum ossiferum TaxID=2951803 RepID=UPI00352C4B57
MENKYAQYKRKKRSSLRKASEGMTAAIILIAFIITAAGIAFVILTMGSSMQLELANVGDEGKDAASSALQVEGGIVTGWSPGSGIDAFAFNVKLVLSTGQVDLTNTSIVVWLKIGTGEEVDCANAGTPFTSLTTASASSSNEYTVAFVEGTGSVITADEMARFYISSSSAAAESSEVVIAINTGVALLKITKMIPVGLSSGMNIL